jgi:hypothetical protein
LAKLGLTHGQAGAPARAARARAMTVFMICVVPSPIDNLLV